MGLAVDSTNDVYDYVPVLDRQKPLEQQRRLVCRFLSVRDMRKVEKLLAEARPPHVTEWDQVIERTTEALKSVVVDWKGFRDQEGKDMPFDLCELDAVFTRPDFTELRDSIVEDQTMTLIEKKEAALQSLRTSANSAATTGTPVSTVPVPVAQ